MTHPGIFSGGGGPSYKKSDFVIVKTKKSVLPSSDLNLPGGTDPPNPSPEFVTGHAPGSNCSSKFEPNSSGSISSSVL